MPAYAVKLEGLISAVSENLGREYKLGLGNNTGPDLGNITNNLVAQAAQWAASFLNSILTRGEALIGLVSLLVVTRRRLLYAARLAQDGRGDQQLDTAAQSSNRAYPRPTDRCRNGGVLARPIARLSCLGLWYGIGLSLIGLNFGLLIGISAGALTFIPYVGSLTALVFSGRRHRSGLAGLEAASHVAHRHLSRAISRREYFVAEARW